MIKRLWRFTAAIVVAVAALMAPTSSAGANVRHAPPLLEGIPRLSHIFIVVLENESFSSTWGSQSPAKYLNALRKQGELLTNYYGVGHSSTDNYISLTSGEPPIADTMSDCGNWNVCVHAVSSVAFAGGRSIGDQLEASHLSWKGYFEDMHRPCMHSTAATDSYQGNSTSPPAYNYADRHNPFIYYQPIVGHAARCKRHVVSFRVLNSDLKRHSMPNYALIVPNTCDDGHDSPCAGGKESGGLVTADAWAKRALPPLISYVRKHNGLLVITFDEGSGSDTSGCCGGGDGGNAGFGGRVGLLAISPRVPAGMQNTTAYDHPSLLRTAEDAFGISQHLNNAASSNEHAMTDLFSASG